MKTRYLTGRVGASALALLLTSTALQAQDTTVRMWFNGTPEAHGAVLDRLIPEFEAANPGINVEYEITAWSSYQQQIATAAAGGTLPDIIFGFSNLVAGFRRARSAGRSRRFFDPDDFVPATVDLTSWNGTWSMLPTWFSANGLSWRSDLIEAGGNDASEPPPTGTNGWPGPRGRRCATTRQHHAARLLFVVLRFNRSNLFTRLVEANGGAMFSDDGMTATMNAPERSKRRPFTRRSSNAATCRARSRRITSALGQGRTAMVYNNYAFRNWQSEFPDLLQYAGLGLVPPGPQGTPEMAGSGLGANVIGITSTPRTRSRGGAAGVPDRGAGQYRAACRSWRVDPRRDPSRRTSLPSPRTIWRNSISRSHSRAERRIPSIPTFSEYESILNVWLDELMLNGMDPQEAMDSAAAEIQSEIIDRSGIGFN